METSYKIFNRQRVKLHRQRAAKGLPAHDFLLREIAGRLCDRLPDLGSHFPWALDLGAHDGVLAAMLGNHVQTLIQADMSANMLAGAKGLRIVADEELLPFAAGCFDLVLSAGSMHWVNDLPGSLVQINRILKPGGVFLAILPGGETLKELRQSFEAAEMAQRGGISPRVSPFIDARDGAALLQRAGFAEPVADSDILNVSYEHPLKLLRDLRGMGEANAIIESAKGFTPLSLIMGMVDHYLRYFSNEQGRINATFELVTLTAFRP